MDANNVLTVVVVVTLGVLLVCAIVNTLFTVLLFHDKKRENVRLSNIEEYLKNLSEEVESQVGDDTPPTPMYHSVDGKYHAKSLPELIQQMMADPENNIPKDTDFSDPKVIQQFLKDINSEPTYEEFNAMFDEHEDEDEEDEKEDWQK